MNVSSRRQSLVQLCLTFYERGEIFSNVSCRTTVEGDHNFLVGEVSVDNLDCSDRELYLLDMSLFGSLALELGSSGGDFYMVDLGLDTEEGVLSSSTAR